MFDSYFIAAVALVIGLVILRFVVLRWRNQAFFDFLRTDSSPQHQYGHDPPNDSDYRSMYHGLQLAPVPAAYLPAAHRVRAADTDAHGRRLGPGGEVLGGKDLLPAYDNFDRPPKYVQAGWSQPGPPQQPVEQSAVMPSANGEQSGTVHPDHTSSCPRDNEDQSINNTAGDDVPAPHHALALPSG